MTFAFFVDSDMLRLVAVRKAELLCGRRMRNMRWRRIRLACRETEDDREARPMGRPAQYGGGGLKLHKGLPSCLQPSIDNDDESRHPLVTDVSDQLSHLSK